jgi:hypothetical protein
LGDSIVVIGAKTFLGTIAARTFSVLGLVTWCASAAMTELINEYIIDKNDDLY